MHKISEIKYPCWGTGFFVGSEEEIDRVFAKNGITLSTKAEVPADG